MNESHLVVFTTAPTGLGHLRVMNALIEGLPSGQTWGKIGLVNFRANKIHALGSRIPLLKNLTEFYQTNPYAEELVTKVYTWYLRSRKNEILDSFSEVLKVNNKHKKWIVVCTHFAMAHSIAAAKKLIYQKLGIKFVLCVVITDDSPQKVWTVKGADIIFSPSKVTTEKLLQFTDRVVTNPFPVSLKLAQKLPQPTLANYFQIPISGAAVQLPFFETFIKNSPEDFRFYIVGQQTMYTANFFEKLKDNSKTKLFIGNDPEETINLYQNLFDLSPRAMFEITKPSEQIFKAIFEPNQKGGIILLLTPPIGRQEKDNLDFLKRHNLIGTRALVLPEDPTFALEFVKKLIKSKQLNEMLLYKEGKDPELKDNGVLLIWKRLREFIP